MPAGYKLSRTLYDEPMNAKPHIAGPSRRSERLPPRPRGALAALLITVGALLTWPAAAQPRLTQGALLISTDEIGDPSWSQTVVLLLHHDANGTLGVAINRPTEVALDEIVPDLGEVPDLAAGVFRGGPVRPTQLVYLVRNPPPNLLRNAPRILDGVYASGDLGALPQIVEAGGSETLRLYAGHVEWSPGQLDREIAEDRWTITLGSAERIFAPNPSQLWQRLRSSNEELLVEHAPSINESGPLQAASTDRQ